MLMRPAFDGHDVVYVTTLEGLAEQFNASPAELIPDCTRSEKRMAAQAPLALLGVLLRHRPHVIVSTGALPGVIALGLGRRMGARTVWVDSVANAEDISMSGKLAKRFAHLWMSQWPHVAEDAGAVYAGAVL